MSTVEALLDTARRDTELLELNVSHGDRLHVAREVQFLLRARERDKAELVASFIDDNRYGEPRVEDSGDGAYNIIVVVYMPITQSIACSVSGLMACLAQIFDVEYDGWESDLQPDA
jgi:hypothetical protein